MLVVVAIILALAAIAVPITFSVLDSSKRDIAKAQIKGTLVPAVERLPCWTRTTTPAATCRPAWDDVLRSPKASLKPEALNDPWGQPYQYSQQSSHGNEYDIWSQGSGGVPVGNWKE